MRIICRCLTLGLLLFLTNCAAPPSEVKRSLHQVLTKSTGFSLGESDSNNQGPAVCAVESRYGNLKTSPVSELICVDKTASAGHRIRYRVNYTTPETGHRIWKISASFPEQTIDSLDIVDNLEKQFGPPHKVTEPLGLIWEREQAYLEIREDRNGVHMELWDRTLRK